MGEYRTIVADPPWKYGPFGGFTGESGFNWKGRTLDTGSRPLPYDTLSVAQIAALPVGTLAAARAHCYLWTTSRYLPDAFGVLAAWGFTYSQTLVWAKTPRGIGPGGLFTQTTEFVLFGWRGALDASTRLNSSWFNWPRTNKHSQKPEHFIDMVESVSPGPYLEMFSRRHRLGWSVWGDQVGSSIELPTDAA